MRVRHLMVPGLSERDLEHPGFAALMERDDAARSRLVSSFPATIPVQEMTLLTGEPPLRHGLLFEGETPRVAERIRPWHERVDELVRGGTLAAVARRLADELAGTDLLIVSGAPSGQAGCRTIDPPPVAPEGFRIQTSDCFALCSGVDPSAELPSATVQEWLRTPGIERVLSPTGESAGAWMAPADRGWILVAEPGWQFGQARQSFGHPDRGTPVLLGIGTRWPVPWPTSVHDWRVAPTLLAAAGEACDGCFDAPLEGADRLQG